MQQGRRHLVIYWQCGEAHTAPSMPTQGSAPEHPLPPICVPVHGMNLQVIAGPDGDIVRVSGPLPIAVHDLTAARIWGIVRVLAASGLVVPGDKGYIGEDGIRTPWRGRNKPASQKEANRAHARLRALGERASARLKSWRILRKLRCCPWRAGQLAKAIHVLPGPRNRGMERLSDWAGPGRQLCRIPGGNVVTCADVRASSVPRRPRAADAGRARGRWGAGPARGRRTRRARTAGTG